MALELAVNVPGANAEATVEPVEQKDPGGQIGHDTALVSPGVFEYEPAGHGSSAAAPVPQ